MGPVQVMSHITLEPNLVPTPEVDSSHLAPPIIVTPTRTPIQVTCSHVAPPIIGFLAKHPVVANFDLSPLRELFCAAAPLGENQDLGLSSGLGGTPSSMGRTELEL